MRIRDAYDFRILLSDLAVGEVSAFSYIENTASRRIRGESDHCRQVTSVEGYEVPSDADDFFEFVRLWSAAGEDYRERIGATWTTCSLELFAEATAVNIAGLKTLGLGQEEYLAFCMESVQNTEGASPLSNDARDRGRSAWNGALNDRNFVRRAGGIT